MKKLTNKRALITGASKGIGRATTILFAQEGCEVIVNYNTSDKEAHKVVQQIEKLGGQAHAIKCNVTDINQIGAMKEQIKKQFGTLDILVNNAGAYGIEKFDETNEKEARQSFEVNYFSVFNITRLFKPLIPKGGRIINVSSISGMVTSSSNPAYGGAKAAVIHLTKTLALELAPFINVNTVAPGWVDTDMARKVSDDFTSNELKYIPLQRFSKPEEIAPSLLFLASDDSNYITGNTIVIDGGYSLK